MLGGAAGLAEVADHAADIVVAAKKAAAVVDTAVVVCAVVSVVRAVVSVVRAVVSVVRAAAVMARAQYERPAARTWKIPTPVAFVFAVVPFAAAFLPFDA